MNIKSWNTWKKKNNPSIYLDRDLIKGWAVQKIRPTLIAHGFYIVAEDFEYGFEEKTSKWAKEEAQFYIEQSGYDGKECEFVYFFSKGSNNYMDYRAVYVRFLNINYYCNACINCEHFNPLKMDHDYIVLGSCDLYQRTIIPYQGGCCSIKKKQ